MGCNGMEEGHDQDGSGVSLGTETGYARSNPDLFLAREEDLGEQIGGRGQSGRLERGIDNGGGHLG